MIPNLEQLDSGLIRGGQPDFAGWNRLKAMGVELVIKLNTLREGSDEDALELGMKVLSLPIDTIEQVVTEPSLTNLVSAAKLMGVGVFVHCTHGQDRTGLAVGYYRVLHCGWDKGRAWEEMINHGFHPLLLGLWKAWDDLHPDTTPLLTP